MSNPCDALAEVSELEVRLVELLLATAACEGIAAAKQFLQRLADEGWALRVTQTQTEGQR